MTARVVHYDADPERCAALCLECGWAAHDISETAASQSAYAHNVANHDGEGVHGVWPELLRPFAAIERGGRKRTIAWATLCYVTVWTMLAFRGWFGFVMSIAFGVTFVLTIIAAREWGQDRFTYRAMRRVLDPPPDA